MNFVKLSNEHQLFEVEPARLPQTVFNNMFPVSCDFQCNAIACPSDAIGNGFDAVWVCQEKPSCTTWLNWQGAKLNTFTWDLFSIHWPHQSCPLVLWQNQPHLIMNFQQLSWMHHTIEQGILNEWQQFNQSIVQRKSDYLSFVISFSWIYWTTYYNNKPNKIKQIWNWHQAGFFLSCNLIPDCDNLLLM